MTSQELVALHLEHQRVQDERDATIAEYKAQISAKCAELEAAVEAARLAYVESRTSAEPDLRWLEYEAAVTLAPTESLIDMCKLHGLRKPKAGLPAAAGE